MTRSILATSSQDVGRVERVREDHCEDVTRMLRGNGSSVTERARLYETVIHPTGLAYFVVLVVFVRSFY